MHFAGIDVSSNYLGAADFATEFVSKNGRAVFVQRCLLSNPIFLSRSSSTRPPPSTESLDDATVSALDPLFVPYKLTAAVDHSIADAAVLYMVCELH